MLAHIQSLPHAHTNIDVYIYIYVYTHTGMSWSKNSLCHSFIYDQIHLAASASLSRNIAFKKQKLLNKINI